MQQILDTIQALCAHLWGGSWYDYVAPAGGGDPVRTLQTAVTWQNSWLGTLVNFITSNPLVLLFIVLSIVGIAVSMFRRIINAN